MKRTFSWPLLLVMLCFLGLTSFLNHRMAEAPARDQFYVPPPEYVEYFALGFNESMADSFWLRWVQDVDNCQTYLKPVQQLEDKEAKDVGENPNFYAPRHKICDNSWSFKMLDAVTKLAPRFLMPYTAGGPSLAVLTEDYEGATVIFNRALAVYPDNWDVSYRAAYHFLFDVKDKEKAAQLLVQSADHGAPEWMRSLAARLYTESGQIELGLRTLISMREAAKDDKTRDNLDKRIAELKQRLEENQRKGSQ